MEKPSSLSISTRPWRVRLVSLVQKRTGMPALFNLGRQTDGRTDGHTQMRWASCCCCIILCVVLATAYLKGECHEIQWFFCASKKWRLLAQVSRTSDHISLVSRANSFTAQLGRENVVFLQKMSFSAAFPCGRHYFSPHKMAAKNHRLLWHCHFKQKYCRCRLSYLPIAWHFFFFIVAGFPPWYNLAVRLFFL